MAKRDYYEILGISKTASADEIKQSYRRLAKQYHPDMNPNDRKNAEEKFKELSEAYEVLIDPKKKELYDQYGQEGVSQRFWPGGYDPRQHSSNIDDIFRDDPFLSEFITDFFGSNVFSNRRRPTHPREQHGNDIYIKLRLTLEEVAEGTTKEIKFSRYERCETCSGAGGSGTATCPECRGNGKNIHSLGFIQIASICPSCQGTGKIIKIQCVKCSGEGRVRIERTLKVAIPAGVQTGNYIPLRGEGHYGPGGRGNVIIEVEEKEHPLFIRSDDNIVLEAPISITAAVLGGDLEIPTLNGRKKIKIPAGIQSGEIIRIKGSGIRRLNGGHGDELVKIVVHIPRHLSNQEKTLLNEWERIRTETVPEPRKPRYQ
jgi:molecular chaperone DnaJ